jgi:hypothetical protein
MTMIALLERQKEEAAPMVEITPVMHLNKYDHYATVIVFKYADADEEFYFDCRYADEAPRVVEDGIVKAFARYSVVVSKMGKHDPGSPTVYPIRNEETAKENIAEYFRVHRLGQADALPEKVIFQP